MDAGDGDGDGEYIQLLKVYEDYQAEYHHMMRCVNCVPHYTVLWSRGLVWKGVPPPNDGDASGCAGGSSIFMA